MMSDAFMGAHCKHTSSLCASILTWHGDSMLSMSNDYDLTTRAGRIQFALAESDHTPTTAARAIGCRPQAISQWISGASKNIKNDLLFKFSDLTGFEARWIATGEGRQRNSEKDGGIYVYEPRIAAIAATLMHCMEDRRDYIVDATQKELDASLELDAKAEARAKANDC